MSSEIGMPEQSPEQTKIEEPDEPRSTLLALIVREKNCTTCTIYPPGVVVPDRGSRWIKTVGENFVDLSDCQ